MLPITKFAASKGTVLRFPPFRFLWAIAASAALLHGFAHAQTAKIAKEEGVPGKEIDKQLFAGVAGVGGAQDGAKWLEKRMADAECRKSLGDAYAAYRKAPSEKTFLVLAPFAERCSRCATRAVERVTKRLPAGKTERWYVSDGSCWIDDSKTLPASFKKISDDLLTVRRYPSKNKGYRAIVQFFKTEENGEKSKELDQPEEKSPFFAFVAVLGPQLLTPTIATYFMRNKFDRTEKHLWLTFRSQPRPAKLVADELDETELPILSSRGQWYVTSTGNLRYTTAADFGFAMPNIADGAARRTLLEVLVETLQRGDLLP